MVFAADDAKAYFFHFGSVTLHYLQSGLLALTNR